MIVFASYLTLTSALPVTSASGPLPLYYSSSYLTTRGYEWMNPIFSCVCDELMFIFMELNQQVDSVLRNVRFTTLQRGTVKRIKNKE